MTQSDIWINGGYFVLRSEFLDQLRPGEELVDEPFQRLIAARPGARPAPRGLLGSDGHAQGEAVAGEPARDRHAPWELWDARPEPRRGVPSRRAPPDASRCCWAARRPRPRPAARHRRPFRRHRDRLRRDAPAARSRRAASPRSAGSCSAARASASQEARRSAEALLEGVPGSEVVHLRLPRRLLPVRGRRHQGVLRADLKADFAPDVSSPISATTCTRTTALTCELTWNTFRDHLILEYEVPKYDGDMGAPNPSSRSRRASPTARSTT